MDSNLPESTIVNPVLTQAVPVSQPNNKKFFIIGGVVLLLILIGAGAYLFTKPKPQPPPPEPTPAPTPVVFDGARFFLLSEPQTASVGAQIKVSVFVKSDRDPANLFIAKLKFPNQLIQAKSISLKSEATSSGFIKDWFISNWVENTIDNETGSVSLVGGVPNPGFKTPAESSGSAMADVIFEAKAPGDSIISFDDTSAIYRNSDNANILTNKQNITLKITGEAPVGVTPTITSPPIEASPSATPASTATPSPSPTGPPEGDVNQDSKLDLQDLSSLLSSWGNANINADLNKDGRVNAFDYSRLTKLLKDSAVVQ